MKPAITTEMTAKQLYRIYRLIEIYKKKKKSLAMTRLNEQKLIILESKRKSQVKHVNEMKERNFTTVIYNNVIESCSKPSYSN